MPGFDIMWLGLCALYLFQLKNEKGILFEKMKDIASKKQGFSLEKFKRAQYLQVSLCFLLIIGVRAFRYIKTGAIF